MRDIKTHIGRHIRWLKLPYEQKFKEKREEYCHQNKEMAHKGKLNEVGVNSRKKNFYVGMPKM